MLHVEGLRKWYGDVVALRGVHLEVAAGDPRGRRIGRGGPTGAVLIGFGVLFTVLAAAKFRFEETKAY